MEDGQYRRGDEQSYEDECKTVSDIIRRQSGLDRKDGARIQTAQKNWVHRLIVQ